MKDVLYFIHTKDRFYMVEKEEGGVVYGRDSDMNKFKMPTDRLGSLIGAGKAYVSLSQMRDESEFD